MSYGKDLIEFFGQDEPTDAMRLRNIERSLEAEPRIRELEAKVSALEAQIAEEDKANADIQEIVGKYQTDNAALKSALWRVTHEALDLYGENSEQAVRDKIDFEMQISAASARILMGGAGSMKS